MAPTLTEAQALQEYYVFLQEEEKSREWLASNTGQADHWGSLVLGAASLAPRLPEPQRHEAVEFALNNLAATATNYRIRIVAQLAPILSEDIRDRLVDEAVEAARDGSDWGPGSLAPLLAVVTPQKRASLVELAIAARTKYESYYFRQTNMIALCSALSADERHRLRPQIVAQLSSYTDDDNPLKDFYLLMVLPLEERRELLELLPAFASRASRQELLNMISSLTTTIEEVEGLDSIRIVLDGVTAVAEQFR